MKLTPFVQGLTFVVLAGVILWFGKPFLVPLAFALVMAMVLYPMYNWLGKKGAIARSLLSFQCFRWCC